jgi:hypothetical protein
MLDCSCEGFLFAALSAPTGGAVSYFGSLSTTSRNQGLSAFRLRAARGAAISSDSRTTLAIVMAMRFASGDAANSNELSVKRLRTQDVDLSKIEAASATLTTARARQRVSFSSVWLMTDALPLNRRLG